MKMINLKSVLKKRRDKSFQEFISDGEELDSFKNLDEDEKRILKRLNLNHLPGIKSNEIVYPSQLGLPMDNIYSYEDIRHICCKYRLKFLNIMQYKGTICPMLPKKIMQFEKIASHTPIVNMHNSFICAPPQAFNLKKRSDDPLFFVYLGSYLNPKGDKSDYYYLVHSWGNDISVRRRILGILTSLPVLLSIMFVASAIIARLLYKLFSFIDMRTSSNGKVLSSGPLIAATCFAMFLFIAYGIYQTSRIWTRKNFDSAFK